MAIRNSDHAGRGRRLYQHSRCGRLGRSSRYLDRCRRRIRNLVADRSLISRPTLRLLPDTAILHSMIVGGGATGELGSAVVRELALSDRPVGRSSARTSPTTTSRGSTGSRWRTATSGTRRASPARSTGSWWCRRHRQRAPTPSRRPGGRDRERRVPDADRRLRAGRRRPLPLRLDAALPGRRPRPPPPARAPDGAPPPAEWPEPHRRPRRPARGDVARADR
jgi:hypothetical protein